MLALVLLGISEARPIVDVVLETGLDSHGSPLSGAEGAGRGLRLGALPVPLQ
jgi:hypothetical protein